MLFQVVDPLGRTITLLEATWQSHVAKRPSLEGQLDYVRETVRDPDIIVSVADGSHRYYAVGISPRHPYLYLHVLIRLDSTTSGRVRSAWFARAVEVGELEWIRPEPRTFGNI